MPDDPRTPRPNPERLVKPAPGTSVGDHRYTEEELVVILNRAAERQEGVQASTPRYTLADIQEIAADAGIAPDHVASVAATLRDARAPRGGGVLGAPHRFRFEESIDGEVADEVVGELLDLVRRALGAQGDVTEALGTVEWKAQDAFGWTYVTVGRRGGRTTLAVMSVRADAVATVATLGGMGALFGSGALTSALIATAGLAAPLAAVAGVGLATGGIWLATRATWRQFSRRVLARVETVGSALVAAARQAVEDGRVRSDGPVERPS